MDLIYIQSTQPTEWALYAFPGRCPEPGRIVRAAVAIHQSADDPTTMNLQVFPRNTGLPLEHGAGSRISSLQTTMPTPTQPHS